jgi:hypothetical protein
VIDEGTTVFPQTQVGDWILVRVSAGTVGWVHQRLVGAPIVDHDASPASPLP